MGKEVSTRFEERMYVRGPMKIEDLKPASSIKKDGVIRYDFHEMQSLINLDMEISQRHCGPYFEGKDDFPTWSKKNNTIAPALRWNEYRTYNKSEYRDFWHYQMDAVLRGNVINDQTNSFYVGTEDGIDMKKLKISPNKWQLHILELYNKKFHHLADKHGWIKVELWW